MTRTMDAVVGAALHDLSNSFAGIQGILDLSDPARPLAPGQRQRLEALLADGFLLLQRTRHLCMGTRPEALVEPGSLWREALETQLQPLVVGFRCGISLRHQGEPGPDQWPGELLRGWALAVTRQVLPFFRGSDDCPGLVIESGADPQEWRLAWHPVIELPNCLKEAEEQPRDISAHWAKEIGRSLGITVRFEEGRITARIPRF